MTTKLPPLILSSGQLARLTSLSTKTLERERMAGRLKGERRPGVRGYAYPVPSIREWMRYRGMNDLLSKLP